MADIFISFAREDERVAAATAALLESQGWSVWWDRRLLGGEEYRRRIQAELDACRCVVVLWSHASEPSGFVRDEASEGLEGARLVPVLLEEVEQPLGFRHVHAAGLIGWDGDADDPRAALVVASVRAVLERPGPSNKAGGTSRHPAVRDAVSAGPGRQWLRSLAFAVLPLAILAADVWSLPVFRDGCSDVDTVGMAELLQSKAVSLGRLRGHDITTGLDDFRSPDFLADTTGLSQALVTTVFFDDPRAPQTGRLTAALLDALEEADGAQHARLVALLNEPANLTRAAVHTFDLPADLPGFPVRRIYVVAVQFADAARAPGPDGEQIEAGLIEVFGRAARDGVDRLVLPALAVNYSEPGWLTHDALYAIVFRTLPATSHPYTLRLSVYESTDPAVLQQAVVSLNRTWQTRCDQLAGADDFFIRQWRRAMLVALSLCLLVCAFQTRLTWPRALLISTSFVALASATLASADQLVQDSGTAAARAAAHAGVLVVLALCFPAVIRWNPQDIFRRRPDQSWL